VYNHEERRVIVSVGSCHAGVEECLVLALAKEYTMRPARGGDVMGDQAAKRERLVTFAGPFWRNRDGVLFEGVMNLARQVEHSRQQYSRNGSDM
jgi:hypothetical protein